MSTTDEHPYSFVHERDGIVYISGATTIDYATHQPVPGRREALDAALNEVERRLALVGLGLADVAKVTYFLVDLSLRDEANEQFRQRFAGAKPARSVVGVTGAPYGGCAVVDVIAHRGSKPAPSAI